MTFDELAALPIAYLAAPDCVLLMWATWPKLNEACLPLMKAWGFEYVTGFPWVKVSSVSVDLWGAINISVPYGVGFWARGASEPLLIGRKGNPKPPTNGFIGLLSPNLYHSRKPETVYAYAESMPGPYLELFARRARPGWDVWGNEVKSTIVLNGTCAVCADTGVVAVHVATNDRQCAAAVAAAKPAQLGLGL